MRLRVCKNIYSEKYNFSNILVCGDYSQGAARTVFYSLASRTTRGHDDCDAVVGHLSVHHAEKVFNVSKKPLAACQRRRRPAGSVNRKACVAMDLECLGSVSFFFPFGVPLGRALATRAGRSHTLPGRAAVAWKHSRMHWIGGRRLLHNQREAPTMFCASCNVVVAGKSYMTSKLFRNLC